MANVMLGFPNRIDKATISGGAWVESLPLANMKDRSYSRVARSIDLETTSTTFVVDFGRSWPIRMFAFVAHNFSLSARAKIEASNAADFSALLLNVSYDVWGALVGADWDIDTLEWENDNFWLGSYTMEDIEGFTPISSRIFAENVVARYWRITIYDPSNDDGFVQLGRLFMGASFMQPRINMNWGATLGYEDTTGIDTALSGAEYFDRREPVRVMRFILGALSETEGFSQALELVRRAGVSGEIFVVADPEDTQFASIRNFLGRLRQLSPLEQLSMSSVDGLLTSMPFEIKELR